MCTVTWLARAGGFELFCSRDELRTRAAALAPRLTETTGGRFLAPLDPDGGGTWVAVNDRGLALTLLNDYAADRRAGEFKSRGRLVSRLAAAGSLAGSLADLEALDLGRYRPFRLLLLAPGAAPSVRHWDGRREASEPPSSPPLLTSSSRDPEGADRARRALLARVADGRLDADALLAFHRSHEPERGPLSPCMHRSDAATVSFTHLAVDGERATMSYLAGPPCRGSVGAATVHELALRRRPAPAGA